MPVKAHAALRVRPSFAIVARRMSGLYDLMLLLDPTAPEERRNAAISETESMINSGGELVGSYDWGTRRMAYEIDHRPEAEYRLYQFNGDNALLERLNQRLRITRRRAALPDHQGEARPADPAAAGPAGRRAAATTASRRTPRWPPAPPPTRRADGRGTRTQPPVERRGGTADAPAADVAVADARPSRTPPPRTPAERSDSAAGRRAARVTRFAKDPALFGNFLGVSARRAPNPYVLSIDITGGQEECSLMAATNINRVVLTGNLTRDPELRHTFRAAWRSAACGWR